MNNYETIFIINSSLTEEVIKGLIEKFKSLIENNGEIKSIEEWGKKRLAYLINDLNEGYYVFITFAANPEFIQELERIYKITDGIMRHIVIKK